MEKKTETTATVYTGFRVEGRGTKHMTVIGCTLWGRIIYSKS